MAGTILELGVNKYRLMVSGKYDAKGKRIRHSKTIEAKSKRAAEKELAMYVAKCEQGEVMAGDNITLKEFSKRWIGEYAKQNLSVADGSPKPHNLTVVRLFTVHFQLPRYNLTS